MRHRVILLRKSGNKFDTIHVNNKNIGCLFKIIDIALTSKPQNN